MTLRDQVLAEFSDAQGLGQEYFGEGYARTAYPPGAAHPRECAACGRDITDLGRREWCCSKLCYLRNYEQRRELLTGLETKKEGYSGHARHSLFVRLTKWVP